MKSILFGLIARLFAIPTVILSTSVAFGAVDSNSEVTLQRVSELVSSKFISGPNCHDGAHFVAGTYPYFLLVTDQQASRLYSENCSKLPNTIENAPVGSLIQYTSGVGELLHSFVSLGDGRFFQKRSNSIEGPFEIVSLAEVDRNYGKSVECSDASDCKWKYQVYSCRKSEFKLGKGRISIAMDALARSFSKFLVFKESNTEALRELTASTTAFAQAVQAPGAITQWNVTKTRGETLLIFDLAQTVRFIGDRSLDPATRPAFDQVKRLIENSIWKISLEIINGKTSDDLINLAVDFAYGATFANGSQDLFLSPLRKRLMNNSSIPAAERAKAAVEGLLALISSPHISYRQGALVFDEAQRLYRGGARDLLSPLIYTAGTSKSLLPTRAAFLNSVASVVAASSDADLKHDYEEALKKVNPK